MCYTTLTGVDTIKIQIDVEDDKKEVQFSMQQDIIDLIYNFTYDTIPAVKIEKIEHKYGENDTDKRTEYVVIKNKRNVFSICSGVTTIKSDDGSKKIIRYVALEFAGLKSYNHSLDQTARYSLKRVVGYLNSSSINWKITELDIFLDVMCKLKHIYAFCNTKAPNVLYHGVDSVQKYKDETEYIEMFESEEQMNEATKRAYFYDKGLKYYKNFCKKLAYDITRFELKLQPKFFTYHECSIDNIKKALDKYSILAFEDLSIKSKLLNYFRRFPDLTKKELKHIKLDRFRLTLDIDFVAAFLYELENARDYDIDKQKKEKLEFNKQLGF
jgi:hypothetical protein